MCLWAVTSMLLRLMLDLTVAGRTATTTPCLSNLRGLLPAWSPTWPDNFSWSFTEVDKVTEPANLVRRKYLVISGSAENFQRNQTYEFIIVDFQHLEEEKITVLC